MAEWGNTTACQVVLITDGNPGVGPMSLADSLNSLNVTRDINLFPLPFPYPGKLSVVCISSQQGMSKYDHMIYKYFFLHLLISMFFGLLLDFIIKCYFFIRCWFTYCFTIISTIS